jgi:flagellar FliL protein
MSTAEKNKDTEGEEQAAPPKKSKKKLIIFAVIGIVVLALAGGGAYFFLGHKKAAEGEEEAVAEETHEDKGHDQPPVYLKLDSFTTNLAMEEGTPAGTAGQYIQVVVELKMVDALAGEELKNYMPEIKNNILRLLTKKRASELITSEGKDLLANEIRDSVNGILSPGGKKKSKAEHGPVQSVLFSSFIIQ